MRLKKIEVVGFKSFAERQVIAVDEQVTGIIGPNGCGKSNIVDAVRWAMGEQSARHLRGAGMADVIFAGCATRGPSGMAEVTLVLENRGQGDVPPSYLDMPEIAVTRRLYADGTSEYLINKVPARLRDITELLLGTGAGTKGYSIIEQGQVGRLVSSKPEERRQVLDEAAGITRFKGQKAAAERKIQATRQNLLRVVDVIGELEARLGTLRQQAQKAERYKRYRHEAQDLDLWMASHKCLEFLATGTVLEDRRHDLSQVVEDLKAALSAREAALAAKRMQSGEVERELSRRLEAVYGLDNRIQLIESENQYRQRERDNLARESAQAQAEREVVERSLAGLGTEFERVQAQWEQWQSSSAGDEATAVEAAEGRQAQVGKDVVTCEDRLRTLREQLGEHQSQLAATDSRLLSTREAADELQRRTDTMEVELAALTAEIESDERSLVADRERLRVAEGRLEAANRQRQEIDGERVTLRQAIQKAEVELDTTRAELHRCKSRLQSLEEIQQRYRRCASGVQVVMEHQRELGQPSLGAGEGAGGETRSEPAAVMGIMADYIAAPRHLESAVSAMLGDRLEGVVVEEPGAGVRGVELLKSLQEGRTTFLPRTVRAESGHSEERRSSGWQRPDGRLGSGAIEVVDLSEASPGTAASEPPASHKATAVTMPAAPEGVLGRLVDLIDIDAPLRHLAEVLLGDTVVVDSLARALELWHSGQAQSTLVTLDGDRLEPSGVVVGGAANALDSALLQQKREIRELQDIERELTEAFENARRRHLGLAERMAELESAREANEAAVLAAEKERLDGQRQVEHGSQRMAERSRRQQEGTAERERLSGQLAVRREEWARLDASRAEHAARIPVLTEQVDAEERRRAELEVERAAVAAALTEAKVALARWQQQRDALAEARQRLDEQISRERQRLQRLDESTRTAGVRSEELAQASAVAAAEREQLALQSRDETERVHESREQFDALRLELDQLELSLRNLRVELEHERENLKEVEMGLQQIALERRHLDDDIRERFDLDLREVLVDFHGRPLAGEVERKRHAELKRLIARMGEVNLTAIEEFGQVSERYDYLTRQRADLEQAIEQLQEAIDQIDKTTRERFKETFALVNERFQQVFPRLFAGGRAELRLTDPDDLLGTGVEIVAQPPGKQLRSLDLLSGGEKALTATSLVFAVFLIKPSPFCILDEVDAPLDDANVGRFCQLVRELAEGTQFLLITHNKITMESADRLYGVTMQQRGISKLVSVNLRRAVEMAYN